jgi:peptidylprolyl isomerase
MQQLDAESIMLGDLMSTIRKAWQPVVVCASLALALAACGQAPTGGAPSAARGPTQSTTNIGASTAAPAPIANQDAITTPSGLQYIEVQAGDGPKPQVGEVVAVHYTGMLDDGTVFDDSYQRGEPIRFPLGVGQVIPGWDEGIALMNKGGKARLIIPPDLAYGDQGAGNAIPPGATLTFDVELVDIQ